MSETGYEEFSDEDLDLLIKEEELTIQSCQIRIQQSKRKLALLKAEQASRQKPEDAIKEIWKGGK